MDGFKKVTLKEQDVEDLRRLAEDSIGEINHYQEKNERLPLSVKRGLDREVVRLRGLLGTLDVEWSDLSE